MHCQCRHSPRRESTMYLRHCTHTESCNKAWNVHKKPMLSFTFCFGPALKGKYVVICILLNNFDHESSPRQTTNKILIVESVYDSTPNEVSIIYWQVKTNSKYMRNTVYHDKNVIFHISLQIIHTVCNFYKHLLTQNCDTSYCT